MSDYPIEWLADLPSALQGLPRRHPLSWQRVLLEELKGRPDFQIHVIVLRKGIERDVQFERGGVHFHVLRTRGFTRAPTLFWTDTLMVRRALKHMQPDLLHAWGTERGAALVAQRLGHPHLITIQGLLTWYQETVKFGPLDRLAARLETRVLRRAKHVTTESKFAATYLQQRYPQLQIHRVEHAPAGVFHQVKRAPQLAPLRLLFTGHLDHRKGADVLFAALDRARDELEFELIHAGTISQALAAQLQASHPEVWRRYRSAGSLTPQQVAAELAQATLLILPTRADTSPNAVKEAVVAGVPVIATSVGGIPDYVEHRENGWLIPAAEPALLAQAIREWHQHATLGRGEVSATTLTRTREELSPARMAGGFIAAYQAVLKDR